jgi:UDP-glucose 4-epimerase
MNDYRIVITGGAGFIGSNLAYELAVNNDIVIIDDLSTGRIDNIEDLLTKKNVTFIQGSILDIELLNKTCRGADFVFHQAAVPSVSRSVSYPQVSHEANLTGTFNVLQIARKNRIKKVIYASSSSVYGDTPVLPKTEDMIPNPQSPYAVTKLAGEYYCSVFHGVYNLPTICLRYFNVYGPKQNPGSQYSAVIPKFIASSLKEEPHVIFGDGEQTRDFTYIRDVITANILAAESNISGIFNVGTGKRISINQLSEIINRITGGKEESIHKDPRPGDVKHSLAEIDKARSFGYKPKYSIEAGIMETVRWFHE